MGPLGAEGSRVHPQPQTAVQRDPGSDCGHGVQHVAAAADGGYQEASGAGRRDRDLEDCHHSKLPPRARPRVHRELLVAY